MSFLWKRLVGNSPPTPKSALYYRASSSHSLPANTSLTCITLVDELGTTTRRIDVALLPGLLHNANLASQVNAFLGNVGYHFHDLTDPEDGGT